MEPVIHTRTVTDPDRTVLTVAGEVDMVGVPSLVEAIRTAITRPGAALVEIDLTDVTFLDSAGIAALVQGRGVADGAGVRLRVVAADGMVRRVLEVTGVWEHLHERAD
jgi:anti-anti-sigma factor